ncbi:MAG: hypothetical protein KatS3mg005_0522 [Bryobacteraceae bacterium]|nr:MAG: hypothetical protein KatS3mg005_0522 [Bryobacteraceae bacterium]
MDSREMEHGREGGRAARQRDIANLLGAAAILMFSFAAGSGILQHARTQDFLNLYTGAWLARDGQFHRLHDAALQLERERALAGEGRSLVPFVRPHFYALALSPLARLPLDTAFRAWIALQASLLLLLLFLIWRDRGSEAALLAAMFACLTIGLVHGQDNVLMALLAYLGFRSLERGREVQGGLWWSLLLAKFHLALGPLLVLAAGRRRRAMGAFACGAAALAAVSLGLSGVEGAVLYARFLLNPSSEGLYPAPEKLASLQGLAANLPAPAAWTYVLAGLPVAMLALLAFRRPWRQSACLAQGGALYLTPHVYLYDWSVLIPALLLAAEDRRRPWVRGLSLFLLSPLSAAAFLASPFTQAGVHAVFLAWLAAIAMGGRRRENRPAEEDAEAAS